MWPLKLDKYGVRFHTDHQIGGHSTQSVEPILTQFVTLKVGRVWVGRVQTGEQIAGHWMHHWPTLPPPIHYWPKVACGAKRPHNVIQFNSFFLSILMWRDNEGFPASRVQSLQHNFIYSRKLPQCQETKRSKSNKRNCQPNLSKS